MTADGSQPPSCEALMRKYEVSITVVRSAVRELKTEGLVYTYQGKGAFVRDPLPEPREAPQERPPTRMRRPPGADAPAHTASHRARLSAVIISTGCGSTVSWIPARCRARIGPTPPDQVGVPAQQGAR